MKEHQIKIIEDQMAHMEEQIDKIRQEIKESKTQETLESAGRILLEEIVGKRTRYLSKNDSFPRYLFLTKPQADLLRRKFREEINSFYGMQILITERSDLSGSVFH